MKRGKGVRKGPAPEGERWGKNERKRVGERGPKAYSENSDFGTQGVHADLGSREIFQCKGFSFLLLGCLLIVCVKFC